VFQVASPQSQENEDEDEDEDEDEPEASTPLVRPRRARSLHIPRARRTDPQQIHVDPDNLIPASSHAAPPLPPRYVPYSSPLSLLPSLHPRAGALPASPSVSAAPSARASALPVFRNGLDLAPLRMAAARRLMDPQGRLCAYEVPGGGQCRDAGCGDVHLARALRAEPSGAPAAILALRALPARPAAR
jgi:hypothetical protein